jgi:hypothetical protein
VSPSASASGMMADARSIVTLVSRRNLKNETEG